MQPVHVAGIVLTSGSLSSRLPVDEMSYFSSGVPMPPVHSPPYSGV
jgi:hypothetical protein